MGSNVNRSGCLSADGSPGCAAIVFFLLLIGVLLAEHTLHLFEGLFILVAGFLALGLFATGTWWTLKRVLIWVARRMPDEDQQGSVEEEAK